MTLCKDQKKEIVIGLKSFLKGLSRDESKDAVAEAMKQINTEVLKNREDNLVRVLGSHFDKLKFLECPQLILEVFKSKKDEAIAKMLEIWMKKYPDEPLWFLAARGVHLGIPVIRRSCMGIYALMPMVRYEDNVGYTHVNPNRLTDIVKVPEDPYYIIDVEDGRAMLGELSMDAEKIIRDQKRLCLIVDGVIAVGMLTQVLFHHNMGATGSRYESDNFPGLYLNNSGNGKPKLSCWFDPNCPDDRLGFPSCGSRI